MLARGRLQEANGTAQLTGIETLWGASPAVTGDGHYSGRIAFSPDGQYLFFTAGDRQKFTPAQDPKATLGKVLRLTPDGKPAAGNPLAAQGFDPPSGPMAIATCWASPSMAQGICGSRKWGPRAATS